MVHLEFLEDITNGIYDEYPVIEYLFVADKESDTVKLELYDPNELHNAWITTYSYHDEVDAKEDMEAISNRYGFQFKEMDTDVFCEEIEEEN